MKHILVLLALLGFACEKAKSELKEPVKLAANMEIAAVYPTAIGPAWKPHLLDANAHGLPAADVTITGTCDKEIKTIKVMRSKEALPEVAPCEADGSFSWRRIFPNSQAGRNVLLFTAYDEADTLIAGPRILILFIDLTPPKPPTIESPTSPYDAGSGEQVSLSGKIRDRDTKFILLPDETELAYRGPSRGWKYLLRLKPGTHTYEFRAVDRVGHVSAPTVLTVTSTPAAF